jgi:DtxR family Mn-dependent transcriptional regulator
MNKLTPSQEDYLETIYIEISKNGFAKVTDIAKILDVKKASVTGALNSLKDKGLINYTPYSPIHLTEQGEDAAKNVLLKHKVMTSFFKNVLSLSDEEAAANACRIEHIMTEELFKRIHAFSDFIQDYSSKNKDFKGKIEKLY